MIKTSLVYLLIDVFLSRLFSTVFNVFNVLNPDKKLTVGKYSCITVKSPMLFLSSNGIHSSTEIFIGCNVTEIKTSGYVWLDNGGKSFLIKHYIRFMTTKHRDEWIRNNPYYTSCGVYECVGCDFRSRHGFHESCLISFTRYD